MEAPLPLQLLVNCVFLLICTMLIMIFVGGAVAVGPKLGGVVTAAVSPSVVAAPLLAPAG